jgi:hypothetical protein
VTAHVPIDLKDKLRWTAFYPNVSAAQDAFLIARREVIADLPVGAPRDHHHGHSDSGNPPFHFGNGHLALAFIHFRYLPRAQLSEHTAFGCSIPRFSSVPELALGMVQRAGKSPAVWPYGI